MLPIANERKTAMKKMMMMALFAAMVAVVGCKTRTAFYAERVYHAEGHWPKESTDEGGKWTLDFYASRDVSDVSEYNRDAECRVECCFVLKRPDMRPVRKPGHGPREIVFYCDLGTCWWWEGILKDYWGKGDKKVPTHWITHWVGEGPEPSGDFDMSWVPRIQYGNLIFVSKEDAEKYLAPFRKNNPFAYVAPDGSWYAASWLNARYVTVNIYNILVKPEFEPRLDEPCPSDVFKHD
jgi:hypothetical protein